MNNNEVYLAQPMAVDSYYADINKELEKELKGFVEPAQNFIPCVEEENQELFNNDRYVFIRNVETSGAPSCE
jgi:hypothetical protein